MNELARAFQTTTLERFSFRTINTQRLEVLVQSLPNTLVHLDLLQNEFDKKNTVPILRSYLQSNGRNLKYVIIDDKLDRESLEQQESLSLSKVKMTNLYTWQGKFYSNIESLILCPADMNDNNWSTVFAQSTEDKMIRREMDLTLNEELDQNQLNYFGTLFGEQFHFKTLTISDYESQHKSTQIELIRKLKLNTSITCLRYVYGIELDVFNELVNLLMFKTNIIRLELPYTSKISEAEIIMLTNALKFNTVLQSLVINQSQIGDIGFEALLSSLPNSLLELELQNSLISAKSLPYLLDFLKTHPHLKEVSLKQNMISNSSTEVNVSDLAKEIIKITHAYHCICDLDINEIVKEKVTQSINGEVFLDRLELRDHQIPELYNELKKNPNQNWSLNLAFNDKISLNGYHHLADILSSTIVIVELSVAYNGIDEEALTVLLNCLCNKKTLKNLNISSNKLNNRHMENIRRLIQSNSILKEINLTYCGIDADEAIRLSEVLFESSLEILHLDENSVSDRGCASLLSSISPTLKELAIRKNGITESSLQTILNFLCTNQSLKALWLTDNPVCETQCMDRIKNAFWHPVYQPPPIDDESDRYK